MPSTSAPLLAWLLALWAACAVWASCASCGQANDKLESLVARLGDDSYSIRCAARDKLLALGSASLPALREAAGSPDLEVRAQARRLVVLIEQSSYEQRIASFLANDAGAELPGWDKFRCSCGDDAAARAMFVSLLRAEPRLWQLAAAPDRGPLDQELERRCRAIEATNDYRRRREAPWETVCTLLLLASDASAKLEYQSSFTVYNLASHAALDAPMAAEARAAKVKRLLASWVEHGDRGAAILRFQLAYRYRLRECLVPSLELLRDSREQYVHHKAMLVVATFGKPEHLPEITRYLDDTTILFKRGSTGYTCQSRDAALAAALRLCGEDPTEFGFEQLQPDQFHQYDYHSIGFDSEEKRRAAFAKWRQRKAR